ncbi:MAG: iron-sulfur cluster insertion protein ErpA [Gammaproteobacteria bacterium]|nr:iron-sulfur cluster insertion protein ErpA [Gammaproteobacteria bacterium]
MSTTVEITKAAIDRLQTILAEEGKTSGGLRIYVQGGGCSGFQYGMQIADAAGEGDTTTTVDGVSLYVDPISISYLKGAQVDFVDSITGGGFTIHNPNVTTTCGCGSSFGV